MEPQVYGIQNTKELLDFGFSFGLAVKNSLKDGKFGVEDFQYAMPVLPTFLPMIEGGDLILKEFQDLNESEVSELLAYAATKIGGVVDSEKLVAQVKASLKLGLCAIELFKTFK